MASISMAITTTISLQSPEQRSNKSEINPPFRAQMAAMNNNNSSSSSSNNNNNNNCNNNNNNNNINNNKKAATPKAMEIDSTSEMRVGKSCHQCRQKFYSVAPDCHNTQRVRKLCQIKYCTRCLWNRYEEKTEEVMLLPEWECPLCRGICNCSQCMKKKGKQPTGRMIERGDIKKGDEERKAKRPGKISENVGGELPLALEHHFALAVHEATGLLQASLLPALAEPRKPEPQLPRGIELTVVKNVSMPTEDVGNAMQFVMFCSTFREILSLEQEPEAILSNIFNGQPEEIMPIVLCQIQLLTAIMDPQDNPPLDPTDGDRCWLRSLNDCISQSELQRVGRLQPLNIPNNAEYATLSPSERLRILVLLCDECLQTTDLRHAMKAMDDELTKRAKEVRRRHRAAKEKEEKLKKKTQPRDEEEKNGNSPSIPEIGDATEVVEVADELTNIHAEIAECQALLDQYKRESEALMVEPLFSEAKDSVVHVYWRMGEGSPLLRQELHGINPEEQTERWYAYDDTDAKLVEKHIKLNRTKRRRTKRKVEEVEVSSGEEDPLDSATVPGPSQLALDPSQDEPGPSHVEPGPDYQSPSQEG